MSEYKIAANHNNAAGLEFIKDLGTNLFENYVTKDLKTEWHDYESREMTSARQYQKIGRPWCAWIFHSLTRAELYYLINTFCGSNEQGAVTIRTLNKRTGSFANYNATMVVPEIGKLDEGLSGGIFLDVRFEFIDLEAI